MPDVIFNQIDRHFRKNILLAERLFHINKRNEDSLTGALGQALYKGWSRPVKVGGESWKWQVSYNKFSSRTEEPRIGADGIFQITIENKVTDNIITKAILFQAKKRDNNNNELLKQIQLIEKEFPGSSAVFDYGSDGYKGLSGTDISYGSFEDVTKARRDAGSLSEFITGSFMLCMLTGVQ